MKKAFRHSPLLACFILTVSLTAGQLSAQSTPPTGELLLLTRGDQDGTQAHPYQDSTGFSVFLQLMDETPTQYVRNWLPAEQTGAFCDSILPQWFGTESVNPKLTHSRVRTGIAQIRVSVLVLETGAASAVKIQKTVYVAADSRGCSGSTPTTPTTPSAPQAVTISSNLGTTLPNSTIQLTARATDSDSLTFKFYASSVASASVQGTLIGTQTASGCSVSCSRLVSYGVGPTERTFYAQVEVSDGANTVKSTKIAIQVKSSGVPTSPPTGGSSPTSCSTQQGIQISVDAGPPAAQVVGGESLSLEGGGSTAQGTSVSPLQNLLWTVLNDGGLTSGLTFDDAGSGVTTLNTPDVTVDRTVILRLTGTYITTPCSDNITVTVLADAPSIADLSVSKSASVQGVLQGGQFSYTLTATNSGPDAANNVRVTDVLPSGLSFVSATAGCSNSSGTVTCNLGQIANGNSKVVTVSVQASGEGSIVNTASVTSDDTDNNAANNSASATINITVGSADLAIAKSVNKGAALIGEDLVYTIGVSNPDGPEDAANVVVSDILPAQLQFVSATPAECSHNAGTVTCSLGALAVGASKQITIHANAVSEGNITNTATVTAAQADEDSSNNSSSAGTLISAAVADLSVEKTAQVVNDGLVFRVIYTISVQNLGPDTAVAVEISDPLPLQVELESADPSCSSEGGTVTCDVGTLEVGAKAEVQLTARVVGETPFDNTATVSSAALDEETDNNTSTATLVSLMAQLVAAPKRMSTIPNTFVGIAYHNPRGTIDNSVRINSVEADGTIIDGQDEPLAPLGQRALLASQIPGDAQTLIARGLKAPIQGFFLIGTMSLSKMDGIGGQLEDSTRLFFPQVLEKPDNDTVLFLFNSSEEDTAAVTLTLRDPSGTQAAPKFTIDLAPQGSLLGSLLELFGSFELDEGYVELDSSSPVRGFEFVVQPDSFSAISAQSGFTTPSLTVPHFFILNRHRGTLIRLLNVKPEKALAKVRAFDDGEGLIGEAEFEIPGGTLVVRDVAELFNIDAEALGDFDSFIGHLEIDLEGGFAGPFRQDARVVPLITYYNDEDKTLSTLPMIVDGSLETLFLQVSSKSPNYQGLAILNSLPEPATATIEAFDATGNRTASREVTIAPKSRFNGLLSDSHIFGGGFAQEGGYIRVTSDVELFSYCLFGNFRKPSYLSAVEGQSRVR